MSKPKVNTLQRQFYTLAITNGTQAELTLYGEIVQSQPTDWWGDPIDGDFIILDEFLKDLETVRGCSELTIHLNSIGGDAFSAFTIHNRLRELTATKICVVDGVAMSGGSHIMCACDVVKVNPSSIVMIHDASTYVFGRLNSAACTNMAAQLDVIDKAQAEIYARKTGKTAEELRAMMDVTTYLTGREAVEQGFADELIDAEEEPDISVSADRKVIYAKGHKMRFAAMGELPEGIKTHVEEVEPAPQTSGGDKNTPDATGKIEGGIPMTLEELRQSDPEAAEALIAEAQAGVSGQVQEAVNSERQRLADIDEIATLYDAETVRAAKYGENPCTAQEMAFRAAQEMAKQGKTFMSALNADNLDSGAQAVNPAPAASEEDNKPMTAEDRKAAGAAMAAKLRGEKTEEV